MPSELSTLEFALDDTIGGERLTPETVDLPTLRGFLQEVEKFIKGDLPGASLGDSRIRIEGGSVKVLAMVGHLLACDVRADLAKLEQNGDLDQLQRRRAEVIELWQNRAHTTPNRTYSIRTQSGKNPLRLTNESQLQHGSENSWVSVEKYLTGKLVNAGGKQDPNVHLMMTESGETIKVSASEQQLGGEKENLLYKFLTLRVQAQQHLRTHELRHIRLIQFLPHESESDERALENLWQKGREAWRGVQSAAGWVESMRGNS